MAGYLIEGGQRPVTAAPPFWVMAVCGLVWEDRAGAMWERCVGAIVDQLVLGRFLADLSNLFAYFCKVGTDFFEHFIKHRQKISRGAFRNGFCQQEGSRILKKCAPRMFFYSPLAPLGRFGAPFWAQLGAKGLPKSSFLAPSRTKNSKNEAQNEASKNIWNFDWNFMGKYKILDVLNPPKCFV